MSKCISHTQLTPTLELSECKDGFWLWDATGQQNLAMKEKTAQDALVTALEDALERCARLEKAHAGLVEKVEAFVAQFPAGIVEDDDEEPALKKAVPSEPWVDPLPRG